MAYEMTRAERLQYQRRQDAAYQAGEDAVTNLRTALALADMTLPSLSNDGPVAGHGFVRLGGCNAAFANRLAEVITAGADALQHQRRKPTAVPDRSPALEGFRRSRGGGGTVRRILSDVHHLVNAPAPRASHEGGAHNRSVTSRRTTSVRDDEDPGLTSTEGVLDAGTTDGWATEPTVSPEERSTSPISSTGRATVERSHKRCAAE